MRLEIELGRCFPKGEGARFACREFPYLCIFGEESKLMLL